MPPGSKKSIVWNFFKKTTDGNFVICNICKKQLKYFVSTTNLTQHLTRKHYVQYQAEKGEILVTKNSNQTIQHLQNIDQPVPSTSSSSNSDAITVEKSTISSSYQLVPSTSSSSNSDAITVEKSTISGSYSSPPKKRRQLRLFGTTSNLSDVQKNEIDRALIKMIATDFQPISLVENSGFLEYTQKLNSLYTPPSRKILTDHLLPQTYEEVMLKLKLMLNSTDYVSVTVDMWTSDTNTSYVTVTCHFIFNKTIYNAVLATREMKDVHHTGENIADVLIKIFNEWGIEKKVVTVISDNGANIKKAINDYLRMYHHPCVAHTLNLTVKDVLNSDNEEVKQLILKCRNLVAHFKHSVVATTELKKNQELLGKPILKVKQDVSTRWNSTLIMLARLQEIKDSLSLTVLNLDKCPKTLDSEEWALIADCVNLLKPLELMTAEVSGEKYQTMSIIIPLIRGL
ncbi:E3 SUMO-protein ligase ZBED1-like [Diabrotica undecimpunctata]|uniref:E3 SUMO-protein ligase ZBED1-like n=1 Tax=Diabrotica undecimpunctata TaxID=50387 RepID=UPI003B641F8A